MYAQVVVPSYKGSNIDSFSYEVPKELEIKVGQLVVVPFGRKQETGLILSSHSELGSESNNRFRVKSGMTKETAIKQIHSVLFEKPFLLPYQLELLSWMSKYYLATIGNCANAMLPQLPKKYEVSGIKYKVSFASSGQTLVLVPTINNIPQTMALFPKAAKPIVYHSDLRPQEKLEAWLKTLSGQADYVFGTRQAIFFPYPNLKKIILLNEHDTSYKDQRSPYYDTVTIAEKISTLTGASLQIIDSAPKISTYFRNQLNVKIAAPRSGSVARNDRSGIKTKIVSLVDDKLSGNKTAISYDLENAITETLEQKSRILLFLNKKKETGTLYCRTCQLKQTLPKEPSACPNCGSPEIWFGSLNVNSLAKQASKLFPSAKINILDQTSQSKIQNLSSNIDIATSAVFYQLLKTHYDLVAAVSIDSTLNIPEFSAPEVAYSQITNLKRLAKKQFMLQTYQVENPLIEQAVTGNYIAFYQTQLAERKALLYPPYSLLIKLVIKGKNTDKVLEKAENLAQKIKYLIPNTVLLGPFEPYFKKTKPTYHVVLKIPLKSPNLSEKEKALIEIKNTLSSIDAFKIVDQVMVDPSILN